MTTFGRFTRPLVALLLAAASLPALAVAPFKADYRASYMGLQADGVMQLERQQGNRWRYSLQVRNQMADLRQSTVFDEHNGHLRPLSSEDTANLLIKRRNIQADYDWADRQATWRGDLRADRRGPVALRDGDMDALLINLAIARDLAAGRPLNYRMVDEGRIKQMRYTVGGKETLQLDGRSIEVTRVSRVDGDKEMIAWISSEYPVPLRLLQRKGGRDELDLTIKAVH
ncbi:hypothetical protein ABB30_01990 [Stenotrophomonas ginsengisoli]|uniref:DUF3108 domain-containing protein n=1 Tax=Stenotrophomonas ginsengisoli TaxID=336566 RepID=A0A0R0DLK0_9GAMM|nr:DUF3108 domain-containing protein [Stenotrophomonas ginsengisoli]KRG79194.1 hypothetical protein ABB30_01990 [Stenotrophomonas ginsengisoli]